MGDEPHTLHAKSPLCTLMSRDNSCKARTACHNRTSTYLPWTNSWAPCLTETTRASVWLGSCSSIGIRVRSAQTTLGSGCRRSCTGANNAQARSVSDDVAPVKAGCRKVRLQTPGWLMADYLLIMHQISSQHLVPVDSPRQNACSTSSVCALFT